MKLTSRTAIVLALGCVINGAASASTVAAQAQPLAPFSHVFAVLDESTAKAIAGSPYLHDFSGLQEKTMVSDEGHYHGIYLFGRETYVELFGPADTNLDGPPSAVGMVGMGLQVEQIGGTERMKAAVEKNGQPVEQQTFHKAFGERKVDWYRGLGFPDPPGSETGKSPAPRAMIFAAEFIPSYFEVPEANKAPSLDATDTISRARYQRRDYAARLLQNVSAVDVAITREDWPMFRAMLAGGGFRTTETGTGARAVGNIVATFQFVPREQMGLRRVAFVLNSKPGAQHIEVLGRSQLTVGPGAAAVWTFAPTRGK